MKSKKYKSEVLELSYKQNLNIFNYSWNIIIILNDTTVFLMMDVKLLVLVLTLNIQEHSYLIIMAAIMSRGRGGRILPPRTRSQNSYSGYPADGLWVLLINSISAHRLMIMVMTADQERIIKVTSWNGLETKLFQYESTRWGVFWNFLKVKFRKKQANECTHHTIRDCTIRWLSENSILKGLLYF